MIAKRKTTLEVIRDNEHVAKGLNRGRDNVSNTNSRLHNGGGGSQSGIKFWRPLRKRPVVGCANTECPSTGGMERIDGSKLNSK